MFFKKLLSPFVKSKKPYVPWNKGISVGSKKPIEFDEANQIMTNLERMRKWRDLALFSCGFDTMLRGIDLLSLKVSDVQNIHGEIKNNLTVRQHKTGNGVLVCLTEHTQRVLKKWIKLANLRDTDYLFFSERGTPDKPITTDHLRRLVKGWVKVIGLDPKEYSSHSLRRSKVNILDTGEISEVTEIRDLLGHKHLSSTQHYLKKNLHKALEAARQIELGKELETTPDIVAIRKALQILSSACLGNVRRSEKILPTQLKTLVDFP
ncbi:tyrosine-type recombinase/integrase [Terasakiella sp. SH-1]|uniref:tyrosine-type recombinase/integrase n=1 Tax=Terasakiella sp. SH-1 TaxID=2560057 RepID=UPI0010742CC6|nr:tyrosine-type recombinase/integrase [Terasakiella sp. SH-1]